MRWMRWLGTALARSIAPERLASLLMNLWPGVSTRIPRAERVDFLRGVAEKHMGTLLADLGRPERAALMNALLPLAARELPLADLDLLAGFSSPGEGYQPQASPQDRGGAGIPQD